MWGMQSPSEKLDWHQDYDGWMELGDAIATSSWSIDQQGATLSNATIDVPGNLTTVFVSDLELGKSYQLRNIITTVDGRTGVREMTIRCDVQP